jgi:hypothetical protein
VLVVHVELARSKRPPENDAAIDRESSRLSWTMTDTPLGASHAFIWAHSAIRKRTAQSPSWFQTVSGSPTRLEREPRDIWTGEITLAIFRRFVHATSPGNPSCVNRRASVRVQ